MTHTQRAHRLSLGIILVLLLFAFAIPPADALELADGRMKLILHEDSGRFSLSCLIGGKEGVYVPMIASQDPAPRCSVSSLATRYS